MTRIRNPELAEILYRRARACGFIGPPGAEKIAEASQRIASAVSRVAAIDPPLSPATVKMYLYGARTPTHGTLEALCDVLECTPAERRVATLYADAHARRVRARRGGAEATP